jgi:tripartite-type tricarboxylate transporter receptor subunit TctC
MISTMATAVTLVVPYPPGGSPDIAARKLADYFIKNNIPAIVQNIPGAESVRATNHVARSDDESILYVETSTVPLKIRQRAPGIDTQAERIQPVALFARTPLLFVVRYDSAINSLSDLRDQINDGRVPPVFASSGGILEMMIERISKKIGINNLIYVPYKGTIQGLVDVIGGSATFSMINGLETAEPYLKSKKLKVIAIGSEERNPILPDVPTVGESIHGETLYLHIGVLAPPLASQSSILKYNALINKYLAEPYTQKTMENYYEIKISTPEEFKQLIDAELSPYLGD